MVDWFYPVDQSEVSIAGISKEEWKEKVGEIEFKEIDLKELEDRLFPFLKEKKYIKRGYRYLILYDFGASSIFDCDEERIS